uniref:NUDIX domain-containing protein n=1 Tax=Actinokineospora sp. CA-119265 TaxID=3239890 RepID=UPI003F4944C4
MDTTTDTNTDGVTFTADVVLIVTDTPTRSPLQGEVLLIQRRWDPYAGRWALPGGGVDRSETSRQAAARELWEETGVDVAPDHLTQVGFYEDPDRDPRGRFLSMAYAVVLDSKPATEAADDAAAVRWIPLDQIGRTALAFDHDQILRDALTTLGGHR